MLHGRHVECVIDDDEVLLWRVLGLDDEGANEGDWHFESTCCDHLQFGVDGGDISFRGIFDLMLLSSSPNR